MPTPIVVPFRYHPRSYQRRLWQARAAGYRRFVLVWHRRAGKDKTALNFMVDEAWNVRVGTYYYFFPFNTQARKAIWDGMDRDGFRYMEHLPGFDEPGTGIVVHKHETDMRVTLANGSMIQIVGTDNYDSIRSTNPVGCVFSEYSDQDPRAWETVKPILRENGGWAVFLYTPKGKNHGWDLYEMARRNRATWMTQLLTIDDTRRDAEGEDGSPVFSQEDYQAELNEGMDPDFARQEYYCSFLGATVGSFYGRTLERMSEQISGAVQWLPQLPVHTAWDLGVDDMTAIWFFQLPNGPDGRVNLIDYVEDRNEDLRYYADILKQRPYFYGSHLMPHDAKHRELSGSTPADTFEGFGFRPVVIVPKGHVATGINTARMLLPRCYFDRERTARGLDCLRNYRKKMDTLNDTFRPEPVHDWASHGADAFRTLACGLPLISEEDDPRPQFAVSTFTGYDDHDRRDAEVAWGGWERSGGW